MFKVGDKVKCIKGCHKHFTEGLIYSVKSVEILDNPERTVWLIIDNNFGDEDGYGAKNFELVQEEKPAAPVKGLRYNSNKLRWRNFPMFLMKPLIEVAQYGESKYSTFNFLDGQTINDSMDSLKRHLELSESPYDSDEDAESKVNHLAHVAWNALVALHMLKTRPDLDDRYKLPEDLKAVAEEIQRRGR